MSSGQQPGRRSTLSIPLPTLAELGGAVAWVWRQLGPLAFFLIISSGGRGCDFHFPHFPIPWPSPAPAPSPIPGAGLRVLMIFDSDTTKYAAYTDGQRAALHSTNVLSWLDANCAKGTDGKTPEKRIAPDNTDFGADEPVWKDTLAKAKADPKFAAPWIIAGNGKSGVNEAIPATADDKWILAKLKPLVGS